MTNAAARWAPLVLSMAMLGVTHAAAVNVTGNPVGDGWGPSLGNSTQAGTFVEGRGLDNAAPFNFEVYAATYTIAAGSNLLFNSNWQVGDTVLGLGGTVNQAYNTTFRSVLKFGGGNSQFAAATQNVGNCIGVQCGAAKGSLSSGDGGEGAVLISFNYLRNSSSNIGTGLDAAATRPDHFHYYDGGEVSYDSNAAVRDFARIIADFDTDGPDEVLSWQGLLNISAMARSGIFGGNDIPVAGAASIVTFQRSENETQYTEALVPSRIDEVPEPTSFALVGLSLAGLAATRRRTKSAV